MKIGMIGLGKMGANMSKRLLKNGHEVVVHDHNEPLIHNLEEEGAQSAYTIEELLAKLLSPRIVWLMVPAGDSTESTLNRLAESMNAGDIIIDGGNSYYKDTQIRGKLLSERGIHFIDAGTSGGVWGLEEGYSLMVGGDPVVVEELRPILETLAPNKDKGWGHVGPIGSGHFVKMVHNGIEYGLMQAYAEGFELMKHKEAFALNLPQIANIWRDGSVIRSWLLDLTANALEENPELDGIAAYVPDSGEGRWTVAESIELNCAIPVITAALQRRFRSREEAPFGDKILSAMRNQFGGHVMKRE